MKHLLILVVLFLACFFMHITFADTGQKTTTKMASIPNFSDNPPNWPWKGINVQEGDKTEFDPAKLESVIPSKNTNHVKLYLKPVRHVKNGLSREEALEKSFDWAKRMLDEIKRLDLSATILITRGFPLDPKFDYGISSGKFWSSAENRHSLIQTATQLSKRFSDRGNELATYQILSEPVNLDAAGQSPIQWKQLSEDIIRAIRANDPKRWITVNASTRYGDARKYKDAVPRAFPGIIYNAHMYAPHQFTHQLMKSKSWAGNEYTYPGLNIPDKWNKGVWNKSRLDLHFNALKAFQAQHNVPIIIGSFSAARWAKGGEQWLTDVVDIYNKNGWSWTYSFMNGYTAWDPKGKTFPYLPKIQNSNARWELLQNLYD